MLAYFLVLGYNDGMEIFSKSAQETILAAQDFASQLALGDVVRLEGDLGAGKTTFAKGVAKGLGIVQTVTSPTFALSNEYTFGQKGHRLVHIDAYRLEGVDAIETGICENLGAKDCVCLVEWSCFLCQEMTQCKQIWKVTIERMDQYTRRITIAKE